MSLSCKSFLQVSSFICSLRSLANTFCSFGSPSKQILASSISWMTCSSFAIRLEVRDWLYFSPVAWISFDFKSLLNRIKVSNVYASTNTCWFVYFMGVWKSSSIAFSDFRTFASRIYSNDTIWLCIFFATIEVALIEDVIRIFELVISNSRSSDNYIEHTNSRRDNTNWFTVSWLSSDISFNKGSRTPLSSMKQSGGLEYLVITNPVNSIPSS